MSYFLLAIQLEWSENPCHKDDLNNCFIGIL